MWYVVKTISVCVMWRVSVWCQLNPLNAELNSTCHLLALLVAHHIFHVSRIRVNERAGYHNRYSVLSVSWPIHGSNSALDKRFFSSLHPSRPAVGPTRDQRVFPGLKRPGRGVLHSPPHGAGVKYGRAVQFLSFCSPNDTFWVDVYLTSLLGLYIPCW